MLYQVPIDLNKLELKNARVHAINPAPSSPVSGQIYYDTTANKLYYYNGSGWVDTTGGVVDATTLVKGIVQLAGDLAGTAALPVVAPLAITDAKVAAANKDGAAGTPSMRTLGTGAVQAASGTDSRFTDSRAPNGSASGDLTGTYPGPTVAAGAITDAKVAAANKDGAAGTASMRTLGLSTAVQAMPGNTALNAITAPTADVNLNSRKITALLDPTSAQDAATKAYVDATSQGLDVHGSVRVASTANVAIPPGGTTLTIDGVALANGDRVLLKDQSTGSQNGTYVVAGIGTSVTLARSSDADTSGKVNAGMFTFVEEGTVNADSGWVLTTDNPIVLATTTLAFAQFSGAGSIVAGTGAVKSGNTINVGGTGGITANADDLSITALGVTNAMIANGTIDLPTKVTGALGTANGGTGQITPKLSRETGLGAAGYYSSATHSSGTTITITQATHLLRSSRGLIVQVRLESTGEEQIADTAVAANGDVTVSFAVSQSANTYRVTIIG